MEIQVAGRDRQYSEAFLKQANEQFENQKELSEADLKQRQQAIDELVKPVKENLAKFEKRVNEIEEKREGAYEGLTIQTPTSKLTARRTNSVRASCFRVMPVNGCGRVGGGRSCAGVG